MFTVFKRIFMIFVFTFALQALFGGYSFAESSSGKVKCEDNPPVCGVAPQEFLYYVDFTREILSAITTVQGKGKDIGDYDYIGGLFTNKILNIPTENKSIFAKMVSALEESMSRKISTVLGVTNILSSLAFTSYKDVIGLSILIQARPIVRDWKTLLDLETNINDVIYELSLSSMANEEIADKAKFQKIIDKYTQDKPLFVEGKIYDGAKYKDLTNILVRLNGAMKTFIPYGRVKQFDEFKRGGQDGVYLKFNTGTMVEMKLAYRCARWFKCSSTFKDFFKNTKIWSNLKKGGSDAKQKISQANKKLAESIKGIAQAKILKKSAGEEYLSDTEIELLRDVYGIDTSKLTKQEGIGFRDLLQVPNKETLQAFKFKSQGVANDFLDKQSKANANTESQEAQQTRLDRKYIDDLLTQNQKKLKDKIDTEFTKDVVVDQNLVQDFKDVITIVNKQQRNDLAILWSTNSVDFLAYYTNIGKRVRQVIDIIGNKDKNIINNIGAVCEIQCSNKGIDGCYAN